MGQHIKRTYFTNCPCTWSTSSLVLYSWEKREGREGGGDGASQLFMDLEVSDVLSSASP